ncbi:MAG: MBL fold metallo-hydrolase [Fidelibacterota bacterium]|nr:MAG: MBL fold metallo-hydrolase [Candidatus Neomarinimicrobiota bacterium]
MLKVASFEGGYDRNFSYLIWCSETGTAAIVDTATSPEPIEQSVREQGQNLMFILLTHTHGDHLAYLEEWIKRYPRLEVVGHQRPVRKDLPAYRGVPEGTDFELGHCRLSLIETPGHYPDCVCWYSREGRLLFTGDTVFVGRTGRTLSSMSSTRELYHSVYGRILILPPETTIYPGHDYGPTPTITIGELKKGSAFFRCADEREFAEVMAQFEMNR